MDTIEQRCLNFRRYFPGQAYWLDSDVRTASWESLLEFKSGMGKAAMQLMDKIEKRDSIQTDSEQDALDLADEMLKRCVEEINYQEKNGKQPRGGVRLGGKEKKAPEAETECRRGGVSMSFRDLFGEGDLAGYQSNRDFWLDVVTGRQRVDHDARSMMAGVGVSGGYAVPSGMIRDIWQAVETKSVFLPRCMSIRMDESKVLWPRWRSEDRSAGSTGGFMGGWSSEGKDNEEIEAELGSAEFNAHKLIVYISATMELVQDSIGIGPALENALVENLTFILDRSVYNGDGVGKPLGLLRSPAKIQVARAAANAIGLDDVLGMLQRLHPQFFNGAYWFVSPSVLPELITLADAGSNSLWVSNVAGPVPGSLFGIPVVVNEHSAALGTEGDIILAHMPSYCIARRVDAVIEQSDSVHWRTHKRAWRCHLRADGMPLLDRVITPISGATLSSIITLG